MASTITAGNATNGLAMSSDGTGILVVKTGPGTGTTAMTVDASQAVTLPGNLTVTGTITGGTIVGAGGNYIRNQYTSPATWTKSPTLKAVQVTVVGAGGPGVGAVVTPATQSGGSGGGTSIYYAPAPSIPGPQAITAGPGTNSFGAIVSATAGTNTGSLNGGTGSGGQTNIPGAPVVSTWGGNSFMGVGGRSGTPGNPGTQGQAGGGYGGGGGGSGGNTGGFASQPGVAGAPGIVIIEEFY